MVELTTLQEQNVTSNDLNALISSNEWLCIRKEGDFDFEGVHVVFSFFGKLHFVKTFLFHHTKNGAEHKTLVTFDPKMICFYCGTISEK